MKLPRDVDAGELIKKLTKLGYEQTRQAGSHIRLTIIKNNIQHHITIPNHSPIKIGTLNNILKEISHQLNMSKDELLTELF